MELSIPDELIEGSSSENRVEEREVKLSDGRIVTIRKAFGLDLIKATKRIGPSATPTEQFYALLAQCIKIDGKPVSMMQIQNLSLGAILKISKVYNELNSEEGEEEGSQSPSP
jgi:hypothetical protein